MQAADHIDSSRNHNAAMQLLAEAGIYVLIVSPPLPARLPMRCPGQEANRKRQSLPTSSCTSDDSGTTTTFRPYNSELLEDCFATIDSMSQYPNTLGIIVANGAMSTIYSTSLAPMIKTVIRDVKKYMATANDITGQRQLPIGYSASSSRLILRTAFDYFTAGKEDETVDFFCVCHHRPTVRTLRGLGLANMRATVCKLQLVRPVDAAHLRLQAGAEDLRQRTHSRLLLSVWLQPGRVRQAHLPGDIRHLFVSHDACVLRGHRV